MGQFHSDFDSSLGKVLWSRELITLGKKCYLDVLEVQRKDGTTCDDYHIRLKGATVDSVKEAAVLRGGLQAMYMQLFEGEEIEFDMLANGGVSMKQGGNMMYKNQDAFSRKVAFL